MTAPGKHLEFGGSKNYARKAGKEPGLDALIRDRLKEWPQAGRVICGSVREVAIHFGAKAYALVYLRRGQQVRCLEVFGLPEDEADLSAYREHVLALFCGGAR